MATFHNAISYSPPLPSPYVCLSPSTSLGSSSCSSSPVSSPASPVSPQEQQCCDALLTLAAVSESRYFPSLLSSSSDAIILHVPCHSKLPIPVLPPPSSTLASNSTLYRQKTTNPLNNLYDSNVPFTPSPADMMWCPRSTQVTALPPATAPYYYPPRAHLHYAQHSAHLPPLAHYLPPWESPYSIKPRRKPHFQDAWQQNTQTASCGSDNGGWQRNSDTMEEDIEPEPDLAKYGAQVLVCRRTNACPLHRTRKKRCPANCEYRKTGYTSNYAKRCMNTKSRVGRCAMLDAYLCKYKPSDDTHV